ncbi:hypothetical protein [Streptomyces sp. NPDC056061]|uniref:hypothetical protein n=1 Tax=Streptomyces sp. NPDC056061 TaxID=3345700 RepID=UPI0035DC2BF8
MSTLGLPGPARVVLRQHRGTLWITGVLALVGIVALAAVCLWPRAAVSAYAASGCSIEHTVSGCGDVVRRFLDSEMRLTHAIRYAGLAMLLLPVFIGMFVAGPMIGRELESGTYKLSWTQSVPPARWLATKLAVPAALSLAGVGVLSAVCRWAQARVDRTYYPVNRYERLAYGSIGTVPFGYALCLLALGALAGLLLRRTVAAMVATAAGFAVLVEALDIVRDGLWPTMTRAYGLKGTYTLPDGALNAGGGWLTGDGARLSGDTCREWVPGFRQCLADHGINRRFVDYHPASHFWPLQLVETGILLALAALAVLLAFRVLRRRHG